MPSPRVLVLRSPGANCDEETAEAFRLAGAVAERVHVNRLLENPALLEDFQALCVPGGFSYGDDISAGRVLGNQVRLKLSDPLKRFRDDGKLVLGVCNGFQVLVKTGLLDLDDDAGPLATLTWNDHGRYEARWVHVKATPGDCVFLKGIEQIEMPIAHAEGNIAVRDAAALDTLTSGGRIVLRYTGADGGEPNGFPENPNGATANAAGLTDSTGRVLGLMPHPERFLFATQHPQWTRKKAAGGFDPHGDGDGLRLFRNAVAYFG
ncbi:Phosphoribosylformylglycinamidine synthase [Botrimarina colliarenosi]|uniref:Phosphoribosylformylglycinamidine synthase n=1 Tax=Botrimarina colliarenosi TaxID=2528001 RepID=A0A5C6A7K6_9BACT|nr:phosphoribosylformylglycinamidine synthase I [Botrimarina colliarenosi]TWT95992.1 Phosphoribosylformylglycinamidine synthase [Botrimarina colliarenosi]